MDALAEVYGSSTWRRCSRGPARRRHLADFGADVIKVEAPAGDGVRRMGWFPPEGGDSYTWKLLGRGKRGVVLDLKTDAGLATRCCDLVAGADVLIENFRPGTLERLGLGPEVLHRAQPRARRSCASPASARTVRTRRVRGSRRWPRR